VVDQGLAALAGLADGPGPEVPPGLLRVAADLRRRRHRLLIKRARAAN
jgi:hypothetical protein